MADGRHLENRIIAMSYDDAEWISMECLGRPPSLILKTNFLTAGALARIIGLLVAAAYRELLLWMSLMYYVSNAGSGR